MRGGNPCKPPWSRGDVVSAGVGAIGAVNAAIPLTLGADPGLSWHQPDSRVRRPPVLWCRAADCMFATIRDGTSTRAPRHECRVTPQTIAATTLCHENANTVSAGNEPLESSIPSKDEYEARSRAPRAGQRLALQAGRPIHGQGEAHSCVGSTRRSVIVDIREPYIISALDTALPSQRTRVLRRADSRSVSGGQLEQQGL